MAIKKFDDYSTTQAYTEKESLPTGAYIAQILAAEVCESSRGQYIKISADIADGDYKGYFAREYNANKANNEDAKWHCNYLLNVPNNDGTEQDGWTKRKFKTIINALEDSNKGYHFDWDEKKFKGLKCGALFNIRQYEKRDGSIGAAVNFAQITSIDAVEKGTYKMPADKLIKTTTAPSGDGFPGFADLSSTTDDSLPFG